MVETTTNWTNPLSTQSGRYWMYNCGTLYGVAVAAHSDTVANAQRVRRTFPQRATLEWDRLSLHHDDALVAILFAAMALEGFINEAADVAQKLLEDPEQVALPPTIGTFAEVARLAEREHGQVRQKYHFARAALQGGKSYSRGEQPFQDFDLLMRVRNVLVHLKPVDEFDFGKPIPRQGSGETLLEQLRPKNILALPWWDDEHRKDIEAKPAAGDGRPELVVIFQGERAQLQGIIHGGSTVHMPFLASLRSVATARWACNTASAMVRDFIVGCPPELESSLRATFWEPFAPIADADLSTVGRPRVLVSWCGESAEGQRMWDIHIEAAARYPADSYGYIAMIYLPAQALWRVRASVPLDKEYSGDPVDVEAERSSAIERALVGQGFPITAQ